MDKYKLAKDLANTATVFSSIFTLLIAYAASAPCGAGVGECGSSVWFVILIGVGIAIVIVSQTLLAKFRHDIKLNGEEVAKGYKKLIPTLVALTIISISPLFLLIFA